MKISIWWQTLLLLLCLTVMVASDDDIKEEDFLYANAEDNEPVIEYFPAMLEKPSQGDFRESDKPKMVEFYNPYCGACQAYKPTYLSLAKDLVEKFGAEMEIYAVSCQVHKELCDSYEINNIPTVALFQKGQQDPDSMKALEVKEKNPNFIIPYLFSGHGSSSATRGLQETGEENEENKMSGDEEKVKESEEDNQGKESNEGEEEEKASGDGDEEDNQDKESNEGEEEEKASGDGEKEDNQNKESNEGDEEEKASGDGEEEDNQDKESNEGEEEEKASGEGEEEDNQDKESNEGDEEEKASGDGEEEDNENKESGDEEENDKESDEDKDSEEGKENESEEENENKKAATDDKKKESFDGNADEANREFFGINESKSDKGGRVSGAGAGMSKEMKADMDRFREAMKQHHGEKKGLFRRQEPLGIQNEKIKSEHFDNISGGTKAMKAHMPGTPEYKMRQQKIQEHHEAVLRKKSLRTTAPAPRLTFSAGAGGASRFELPANHKPVVGYKKQIQKEKLGHKLARKVPLLKRMVKLSHEEELILDASLSFMEALQMGLFSSNDPLTKHKKRAFQGWLDLLRVSLPPEWGLHETIMDLDNNMDYISQHSSNLYKFLSRHQLPRREWSHSCTVGGAQHGFNCGFWKLLHVVSVGVAEHRGGLNLVEGNLVSKDARVFSPNEAAEAMKEYIGIFFPCTPCANHFVAQYDECSNRRCVRLTDETEYASLEDWQELAKWLWEVHNDVNVRLFRERNAESRKPLTIRDDVSALYPSLNTCLSCYRGDGGYDEDAVFVFLEKQYWPGASDIDPAADKLLYFHNTEYAGFAYSWALLFLGVGIIYMYRPRGVFKGRKQRAE